MKLLTTQVIPDSDRPRHSSGSDGRERPRSSAAIGAPVVRPDGKGRYVLVAGESHWRAAVERGAEQIDCTIRDHITEQETEELRLSERYHASSGAPMELARAFIRYRERYGVTQQELARRTRITPGTIHHYESLVRTLDPELGRRVDAGDLTFKEARSIADIDGHERQREIAEPFLSGRLSSVWVERIVGLAKSAPEMPVQDVLEEVLSGSPSSSGGSQGARSTGAAGSPAVSRPPSDSMEIVTALLRVAGELDALQLRVIPEYRRLKLISCLRILDSRVKAALSFLNSGPAVESHTPRPMAGAER